ncbi:MAG: ATP-dependent Clp protease ATP-binding subunit [Bacteroidales bacterium]|nr:ATP-dependent Clp protease ATP-binding subunit [Bacteroidales bacterium]
MDSHYTEHFKHVVAVCYEEAQRFHADSVKTAHLVLAMLHDGQGKAIDVLQQCGVDLVMLQRQLESMLHIASDEAETAAVAQGADASQPSQPDTRLIQALLKLSKLEARMLHETDVDTQHILLVILHNRNDDVSRLFKKFDVDYKRFHSVLAGLESVQDIRSDNKARPSASDFEPIAPMEEFNAPEDSSDSSEDEEDDTPSSPFYSSEGFLNKVQTDTDGHATGTGTPTLDRFGYDITNAAREGTLDPVVGREREIERLAQILSRRKKNNPILLGEPGVGKTAIVEGLAQRIVQKKVSFLLSDKRIVSLDMAGLVAGTKYRGQFEERLKGVMREVSDNPNVILYIDEIHTMVGAGNAEGSMDAANMLKPALSRGELQCIGSTTLDEYRKTIEKDGALERRFQKVIVEPTNPTDTLAILHNLRDRYEQHHCVHYTDDALQACVSLSERYISDRNLPDKAIDVLDEAGSRMHLFSAHIPESFEALEQQLSDVRFHKDEAILSQQYEMAATYRDQERQLEEQIRKAKQEFEQDERNSAPTIDATLIADVVAQMTGIPVQKVASAEGQKLLQLNEILQRNVIGQDQAIQRVVRAIQRNRVGLKDPKRPIGTFLFLGPTGVGKTYLAKKIAEELFATPDSLIRIDMSEFMEKYSTSRLIGAAPGYIGYEEGGQLTERVRRHPYSVILFDEIEKADHEVFNLLLQLFDEGHLTDATGRKVDFKNCIIILTSNVGSRQLGDFGTGIGFQSFTDQQRQEANEAVIRKELRRTFSPEFLNRIDDIITFRQLSHEDITRIVDVELRPVIDRISAQGYNVEITPEMRSFLSSKGYDPKYGARPLRRAIQEYVEDAVCERILSDEAATPDVSATETASADKHHIVIDAPSK